MPSDPVVLTDDLTRQVHVVKERLTKTCPKKWRPPWSNAPTKQHPERCNCGGSGRVPVEVGDTLRLVTESEGQDDGRTWRSTHSVERSVVWEGPAAKVIRCGAKHNAYMRSYVAQAIGGHPLLLHAIDYDALGIGSDPDAWVYLLDSEETQ